MTHTPNHPIVAVFGSDDTPGERGASLIGAELRSRDATLLTGGEYGSDAKGAGVKEHAIQGFVGAASGFARRVGMPNAKHGSVVVEDLGDGAILLRQPFGHRRNFLEAWMCDVAIALYGGDGTLSEVAFSLALGRPVILAGERWRAEFPIMLTDHARKRFLKHSKDRVPVTPKPNTVPVPDLDEQIAGAYRALDNLEPNCVYRPLPTTAGEAGDIVELALGLVGARVDLPLPRVAALAAIELDYGRWLARVRAR